MSYTGQALLFTNEEIEIFLKENFIARICSYNKDGTIHVAPVGYRFMNDAGQTGSTSRSIS